MSKLERVLLLSTNQWLQLKHKLSKFNDTMKKPFTVLCCVALAVFGWVTGIQNKPLALPTQSVSAAQIPLDLRLGRVETIRDTVYIPSDTVYIPAKPVVVTKIKKVTVPYRITERDTLYVPGLILITQPDRMHTVTKQDTTTTVVAPVKNDSVLIE